MVGVELDLIAGLLVDGIANGLVLALLGLGITLVFGLGGILNLSIGVFSLIGIVTAIEAMKVLGNLFGAIVVAVVVAGVIGLAVDRTLLTLVYRSEGEERMLVGIFATLGLAIFLDGVLVLRYSDHYSVHHGISTIANDLVLIRGSSIGTIGIGLFVFIVLYLFFDRTFVGQASRTVMDDEIGATLCGIDTRRLRTLVFVVSAVVAAIAGIIYSFSTEVNVALSFELTINAIIVSVIGGVTSLTGTVVAGLLLGIVTTFASAYFGAYLSAISLFVAAIIVLLIKPEQIA